jgi:hypothetical protein
MLPPAAYGPIREWLQDAALREDRRVAVLTQTMSGVLDTFRTRVPELASHLAAQLTLRVQLRQAIEVCYTSALAEIDETIKNGSLLRGEMLARWQDFAGTGDLLRTLQSRRRGGAASRPRKRRISARAQALKAAVRAGLESLIVSIGDRAAEEAVARWRDHPAGPALLDQMAAQAWVRAVRRRRAGQEGISPFDDDDSPFADSAVAPPTGPARPATGEAAAPPASGGASPPASGRAGPTTNGHEPPEDIPDAMTLGRSAPDLPRRAAQAISSWQDHVMRLVQAENVTKRSIARVVSFDDESLTLVVIIGLLGFAAGDVTDGTGAAAEELLGSLFGPGPLRDIEAKARADLRERIRLLFDEEMLRFTEVIDAGGVPDEAAAVQLYQATYSLEVVR